MSDPFDRPAQFGMIEVTENTEPAKAPEIRAWARANGYTVGDRGRISPDVKAAFKRQTGRLTA